MLPDITFKVRERERGVSWVQASPNIDNNVTEVRKQVSAVNLNFQTMTVANMPQSKMPQIKHHTTSERM